MKLGKLDTDKQVVIIAELSGNHCNDFELTKRTVKAAKDAGADVIKLQTYTADTITIDCKSEMFRIQQGNAWDGRYLYDLYKEAGMPWEWQPKIKKYAESLGLEFFSAPFDPTAVDFLEDMNIPMYKIASYEITDIPLLEKIAKLGKPIIISTGIAGGEDIELAINTCKAAGNDQLVLLKCTSAYPTPYDQVNLRTMVDMKKRFGVEIGLSDHTMGRTISVAAVALGARVVEKHFILDTNLPSVDKHFSMNPEEFRIMVEEVRNVEQALGVVDYNVSETKKKERAFARSLFVVEDVKQGDTITEKNVRSIRPSYGLPPKELPKVLGKQAKKELPKGTPLSWDDIE